MKLKIRDPSTGEFLSPDALARRAAEQWFHHATSLLGHLVMGNIRSATAHIKPVAGFAFCVPMWKVIARTESDDGRTLWHVGGDCAFVTTDDKVVA